MNGDIQQTKRQEQPAFFRDCLCNGASQYSFDDFPELNRRARGFDEIQITLILNPISENHWIKSNFCDIDSPYFSDSTLLKFTYRDNQNLNGDSFLTENDVKELERLKDINENQYRIYTLGGWGIDNKESKFCRAFANPKPRAQKPKQGVGRCNPPATRLDIDNQCFKA